MSESKPIQKEFTSSAGNKFVFQKVKNSKYLQILDRSTDADGKPLISVMYPQLLKHVVIQPQDLTVDDFETFAEMQEVCEAALNFQQGK